MGLLEDLHDVCSSLQSQKSTNRRKAFAALNSFVTRLKNDGQLGNICKKFF